MRDNPADIPAKKTAILSAHIANDESLLDFDLLQKKREIYLQKKREAGKKGGLARKGIVSLKRQKSLQVAARARAKIDLMADRLIESQLAAAFGTYRIAIPQRDGEGHIISFETVRDADRIELLMATQKNGEDYFIFSGKDPDWKAANALLDRAHGRAKETVEHEHTVRFSLKDLAKQRRGLPQPLQAIQVPYKEIEGPQTGV